MIDLIPKVYTTKRSLRVLGQDGAEKYVTIYDVGADPETGQPVTVHDLSAGKYDTVVTVGPNFTTRRQEAAETYQGLLQGNPDLFPIIGDLVFKSMDLPYAEDIAERMQTMLPPEIQQQMTEGQEMPAEVRAMMGQAQQAMQMVEQQAQQIQAAAAEVQQEATQNEQAKAEIEKLIAQLEAKQAQFEAKIAKDLAVVAEKDARLTVQKVNMEASGIVESSKQEAGQNAAQFQQALAQDTAQVLSEIQGIAAKLSEHTLEAVDQIRAEKNDKPKIVKVESRRVNGKLEAIPVYEDEPTIQ